MFKIGTYFRSNLKIVFVKLILTLQSCFLRSYKQKQLFTLLTLFTHPFTR